MSQGSISIHTIGYGNRSLDRFVEILHFYNISWLIDVRSQPWSRRSEFHRESLEKSIPAAGFGYLFLGHQLGGKTENPRLLDDSGKSDYELISLTEPFQDGLDRLRTAHREGHRIALMCAELEAATCHRSQLIGNALEQESIPVGHIGTNPEICLSQHQLQKLEEATPEDPSDSTPLFPDLS